jgi:protein SFI1
VDYCTHHPALTITTQGLTVLQTTNEQIGQARDNLLIRLNLQHWRTLTASRRELFYRVATLANNRRLRSAFNAWTAGVKEKRQAEWRHGMRMKMKTIREKREGKLRDDAWAKWRQSYRSHLSGQHYIERLVLQFYRHWKKRLSDVDHLEATADEFSGVMEGRATERFWNHWRRTMEMRNAERMVLERVSMRVMGEVMDAWKRNA